MHKVAGLEQHRGVVDQKVTVDARGPVEVWCMDSAGKGRYVVGTLQGSHGCTAEALHLILGTAAANFIEDAIELVLEVTDVRLRREEGRLSHGPDEEVVVAAAVCC